MGRVFFYISFTIFLFGSLLKSQPLFEENFDYSVGVLTSQTTIWNEYPNGAVDIQVYSGSLSYPLYVSSGLFNKINLDGGANGRSGVTRSFTTVSGNGNNVYASFLLKVISTSDMDISSSQGDQFCNFRVTETKSYRGCIFVRQGSQVTNFQIGLGKLNSSIPTWYTTELNTNNIYLIVVAYSFQSGNDVAKMWINPSLNGVEPLPDIEQSTGSDVTSIGEFQFRQEPKSGDMEIDGIRVDTSWSQAPIPVELNSFTASLLNSQVQLKWHTATEVNNYGFDVERQILSNPQSAIRPSQWNKIGFVGGHGNCNSPKEYSFADKNMDAFGKYSYRLKQIDTDGKYEYSQTAEVNYFQNANCLEQNYPNPFNPVTTINYTISSPGIIKILLYNILGEVKGEILNEFKQPGSYSVDFSINSIKADLPSGVYFYKIVANNFSQTRKMLIVK